MCALLHASYIKIVLICFPWIFKAFKCFHFRQRKIKATIRNRVLLFFLSDITFDRQQIFSGRDIIFDICINFNKLSLSRFRLIPPFPWRAVPLHRFKLSRRGVKFFFLFMIYFRLKRLKLPDIGNPQPVFNFQIKSVLVNLLCPPVVKRLVPSFEPDCVIIRINSY